MTRSRNTATTGALNTIATALGRPDAAPDEVAQTAVSLVAAVNDLRTGYVAPSIVNARLAAHGVDLPA